MSDKRFGIIVIGDEILNGRRKDRHFQGIGDRIRMRGYAVVVLAQHQMITRVLVQLKRLVCP